MTEDVDQSRATARRRRDSVKKSEFRFGSARLSFAFTGTCGERLADRQYERLNKPADLARWFVLAGLGPHPPAVDQDDLQRALCLREAIQRTGQSLATKTSHPSTVDVATINAAASLPPPIPQLSADAWQVRWPAIDVDTALSAVARDAIDAFTHPSNGTVKICDDPLCGGLFYDTSRAQRRRWCSMATCGDMAKKLTYRQDRRAT